MAEDNMSNIINNFKNILNNSTSQSTNSNSATSNNNFNITPDMVNNLADMIKNTQFTDKGNNVQNSNSDNGGSKKGSSSTNIDLETILKVKSIMETLNQKDDPRSNLLYSLKPYLRESRRNKIDQYVNLFKITKVTNLFKDEKGDGN